MGKANIPSDAEIDSIRRKSAMRNSREIRAQAVRLLPESQELELTLVPRGTAQGARMVIPLEVEPQLSALTAEQLAALEVYPGGTTLACEPANLHLSVEALVFRALMGAEYHARLRSVTAVAMGQASTEAKAQAARENGKKGGRPRKHLLIRQWGQGEAEPVAPPTLPPHWQELATSRDTAFTRFMDLTGMGPRVFPHLKTGYVYVVADPQEGWKITNEPPPPRPGFLEPGERQA